MTFIAITIGAVIGYLFAMLIFGATHELALKEAYKAGRIDGANAVYRQYMNGEENERTRSNPNN